MLVHVAGIPIPVMQMDHGLAVFSKPAAREHRLLLFLLLLFLLLSSSYLLLHVPFFLVSFFFFVFFSLLLPIILRLRSGSLFFFFFFAVAVVTPPVSGSPLLVGALLVLHRGHADVRTWVSFSLSLYTLFSHNFLFLFSFSPSLSSRFYRHTQLFVAVRKIRETSLSRAPFRAICGRDIFSQVILCHWLERSNKSPLMIWKNNWRRLYVDISSNDINVINSIRILFYKSLVKLIFFMLSRTSSNGEPPKICKSWKENIADRNKTINTQSDEQLFEYNWKIYSHQKWNIVFHQFEFNYTDRRSALCRRWR